MKLPITFVILLSLISCQEEDTSKVISTPTVTNKVYFACTNNAGESTLGIYSLSSNGALTLVLAEYDGVNCQGANIQEERTLTGTWTYNANTGDFVETYQTEILAFRSAAAITIANTMAGGGYCGFNNWIISTTKDITDIVCQDGTLVSGTVIPTSSVILDNNQLVLGGTQYVRIN